MLFDYGSLPCVPGQRLFYAPGAGMWQAVQFFTDGTLIVGKATPAGEIAARWELLLAMLAF